MVYAFTQTSQAVPANTPLNFNTTGDKKNCTITHGAGSVEFNLNSPGHYIVHFNADAVENSAAGDVQVTLQRNGVAVPGAVATATSAIATDAVNIGFTCIVRVAPNCCANRQSVPTALTFVNTGVSANFTNAAVTIVRIP